MRVVCGYLNAKFKFMLITYQMESLEELLESITSTLQSQYSSRGRVYTDSRNASVHHEIGGHVYEDAFNPSLTESQRNRNTEKFEQLVRDIEINMSPIGGRAVKH